MKKERWSEFDKFVVMGDKSKHYIRSDYPAFLDYKVLKSVVQNVVKGQPADNYYHNGVTLDLGVTRGTIDKIYDKMEKLLWDDNIMIIARVLGLRNLRAS